MDKNEPLDFPTTLENQSKKSRNIPLLVAELIIMVLMPLGGSFLLVLIGESNSEFLLLFFPMLVGLGSYYTSRLSQKPVNTTKRLFLTIGISIGILFCLGIFIGFFDLAENVFTAIITGRNTDIFTLLCLPIFATSIAAILCVLELYYLWKNKRK